MNQGAIILCGGRSTRMGSDKATLPFGPESMLQRVVRILSSVIDSTAIVVVAARDQSLPTIPSSVVVTYDERSDRGPLEGLAAGLRALPANIEAIYATSCDVPLLIPAFVSMMFEQLGPHDIAVPFDGQHHHPLAAVYRPSVLTDVQALLDNDQLRPRFLFDRVRTIEVSIDELRQVDAELTTLINLNHPDDYQATLKAAGFAK